MKIKSWAFSLILAVLVLPCLILFSACDSTTKARQVTGFDVYIGETKVTEQAKSLNVKYGDIENLSNLKERITVKLVFDNGETQVITSEIGGYNITGMPSVFNAGTYPITVSYSEFESVTFNLVIAKPAPTALKQLGLENIDGISNETFNQWTVSKDIIIFADAELTEDQFNAIITKLNEKHSLSLPTWTDGKIENEDTEDSDVSYRYGQNLSPTSSSVGIEINAFQKEGSEIIHLDNVEISIDQKENPNSSFGVDLETGVEYKIKKIYNDYLKNSCVQAVLNEKEDNIEVFQTLTEWKEGETKYISIKSIQKNLTENKSLTFEIIFDTKNENLLFFCDDGTKKSSKTFSYTEYIQILNNISVDIDSLDPILSVIKPSSLLLLAQLETLNWEEQDYKNNFSMTGKQKVYGKWYDIEGYTTSNGQLVFFVRDDGMATPIENNVFFIADFDLNETELPAINRDGYTDDLDVNFINTFFADMFGGSSNNNGSEGKPEEGNGDYNGGEGKPEEGTGDYNGEEGKPEEGTGDYNEEEGKDNYDTDNNDDSVIEN